MSLTKVHTTQVDVRGFRHELEPLQRKYEWQLAACEARLARSQQAWLQSKADLQALQAQHQQHVAWARDSAQERFDLQAHQRLLACLTMMDERIQEAERVLHERLLLKRECQEECNGQRRRIEALQAHRDEELQVFVEEQLRLQFAQQDREWMAHRSAQARPADLIQSAWVQEGVE